MVGEWSNAPETVGIEDELAEAPEAVTPTMVAVSKRALSSGKKRRTVDLKIVGIVTVRLTGWALAIRCESVPGSAVSVTKRIMNMPAAPGFPGAADSN